MPQKSWNIADARPVAVWVTMLRLTKTRREALSDTLRELANLTAGAFILGQFVGREPPNWWLLTAGTALWSALVVIALLLMRKD